MTEEHRRVEYPAGRESVLRFSVASDRPGPVELLITNQTHAAHALHVSGSGARTLYSVLSAHLMRTVSNAAVMYSIYEVLIRYAA